MKSSPLKPRQLDRVVAAELGVPDMEEALFVAFQFPEEFWGELFCTVDTDGGTAEDFPEYRVQKNQTAPKTNTVRTTKLTFFCIQN